jgi:hypothetical protein
MPFPFGSDDDPHRQKATPMKPTDSRRNQGRPARSRPGGRRARGRSGPSGDGAASTRWSRHGTALPNWSDLDPKRNQSLQDDDGDGSFLQRVSTVRFALGVLAVAALFTLYVGHVHATQQLLSDVQQARSVNQTLHLKHNRLKGAYDRKTGPSVIYERARELGLRERLPRSPVLTLDESQ